MAWHQRTRSLGQIYFNDTDESDDDSSDEIETEVKCKLENDSVQAESDYNNDGGVFEDDEEPYLGSNSKAFEWVSDKVCNQSIHTPEFSSSVGPVHTLPTGSSALEYLRLFFTDEVCERIRESTNAYAAYCSQFKGSAGSEWEPITSITELWDFFAVLLVMSLVHIHRTRDYWSKNETFGNCRVKSLMSRSRFMLIKQYLHIFDLKREEGEESDDFRCAQKVEPLQAYLKEKFMEHFKPHQQLLVDEAIVRYIGRLGVIPSMSSKPERYGLKIWILCTPSLRYTLSFELDLGRKSNVPRSKNGLGYDIMMQLVKDFYYKNHTIYFDSFFSSVSLMIDLLQLGIYSCGTVPAFKKNLPEELRSLQLKSPYEMKCFQCKQFPNLLCTTWLDKKQTHLLSTHIKNDCCLMSIKYAPEKKIVQCPIVFADYSKHMGGIDLADQQRRYISVPSKSPKLWWNVFSFLFETAINNAYILHMTTNSPLPKKAYQLHDFKVELIDELAKEGGRKRKCFDVIPTTVHFHKKRKIDGRKRTCVRCRKLKLRTKSGRGIQSSFECEICKMCLCITCFVEN